MINGWLNLPWFLWATLALIVAVVWIFIWPRKVVTVTTGFRYAVIRWGHALTWVLLGVSFIMHGIDPSLNGTANWVAVAGGMVYLLFMTMTFVVK